MAALSLLPFINFAPNRFIGGQASGLLSLANQTVLPSFIIITVVLLLAVAILWGRLGDTRATLSTLLLSCLLLAALFTLLGQSAHTLMATANPAARVSIGAAFWVSFLLLNLVILDAWQRSKHYRQGFVAILVLMAVMLGIAFSQHAFDALSLVKEYHNQQDRFTQAVSRHIQLVAIAFVPTLFIGLLLGWLVWRHPRINGAFFGVLNFLQTIPSIALFALLMVPLSWLAVQYPMLQAWGISGIGAAPSVIALVLYTLLPLSRNTYTGLNGVPADTIEAARAMGMTQRQIFRQILLPLSLPVILSGMRIVIVQLIGLTVVAALIGAGGLGAFVWEGLGQYALDLVLLGALPTIVLAVVADFLLQGLILLAQPIKTRGHA